MFLMAHPKSIPLCGILMYKNTSKGVSLHIINQILKQGLEVSTNLK